MIAIVGVDLLFYVYHRIAHRVRLIWATHQAHHSSQYFNFATALRQKWNNSGEILMWIPLPLFGVPPWMVFASFSINLVYQFWIHTERIGKLWRPIEFVFNTPSHHRVHHGMDQEYLDKNYGGILIIWDRLFGTLPAPRLFRPHYGLTKQVDTFNIWKLQTHEYAAIGRDVRAARGVRDKLGYVFGPPGWLPAGAPAPATSRGPTSPDSVAERTPPFGHAVVCAVCRRSSMPTSTPRWSTVRWRHSTFGSMWLDMPRPDYPAPSGPVTCDLLVVGGGYTGLWSALHAAERHPDRRIVLIEAEPHRMGGVGTQRRLRRRQPDPRAENGKSRWPNEIDTLEAMGMENLDGMQAEIDRARAGHRVAAHRDAVGRHRTASGRVAGAGRGRRSRAGFSTRQQVRDEVALADLSGGPVQPRHLRDRPPRQAGARTGPRLSRTSGVADLRTHHRHADRLRRGRVAGAHRRRRRSRAARWCWRPTSIPSLLQAQPAATPCRCTTTCWRPSRSPTPSWTASGGSTGRESATPPTSFTTTG